MAKIAILKEDYHWLPEGTELMVHSDYESLIGTSMPVEVSRVDGGLIPVLWNEKGELTGNIPIDIIEFVDE